MPNPWKDRVLAYNKRRKATDTKAADLDVLVAEIAKLLPGQLKKMLPPELLAVLEKYGYEEVDA